MNINVLKSGLLQGNRAKEKEKTFVKFIIFLCISQSYQMKGSNMCGSVTHRLKEGFDCKNKKNIFFSWTSQKKDAPGGDWTHDIRLTLDVYTYLYKSDALPTELLEQSFSSKHTVVWSY